LAIVWRQNAGDALFVPTHSWVNPPWPSPPESFPIASMPFVVSSLEAGHVYVFGRPEDVPDPVDRETFLRLGLRPAAIIPLAAHRTEGVLGALTIGSMSREQEWAPPVIERLRLVAGVISQAFARRVSYMALQNALNEIRQLRDRVAAENIELRRE